MLLNIITPDKKVFEGEVISSTFPGSNGSFEVLKDHAPIISSLEEGNVKVKKASGEIENFVVSGGIVEVLDNKITLLAEGVVTA